jgi:hypothetical protein|nr:MAG TPA: hypothetical protein [Caudoviricetes sp.]
MFHVKHCKRTELNSVLFNISITLILNAWVGTHPTTQACLIFQRAFHAYVTKITNADTVNNTLRL